MGSASNPPEFWGYLIKPDKSPSVLFEQLLLGVADYINRQVAPWDVDCLTPTKLAAFYRLVGGDYDPLFLETPHASLSFIYQSLGCFHSLQQEKSPYTAPSVPALTRQGFVRWQTVQVLLEPDDNVAFLQNAVKRLEIINPTDGNPFQYPLPREALPSRPDPEMVRWHQGVGQKLMVESHAIENGALTVDKRREIDDDVTASRSNASSLDDHSFIDTARYFTHPRPRPSFHPPPSIQVPQAIDPPSSSNSRLPPPWQLERRRSSASDIRTATTSTFTPNTSGTFHQSRPRSPSTVSTSSVSSSSSMLTSSSTSVSPRQNSHDNDHPRRQYNPHAHERQQARHHGRRHSSHLPYAPQTSSSGRNFSAQPPPSDYVPSQQTVKPPGSNSRGLNVRWGDMDAATLVPRRSVPIQDARPMPVAANPRRMSGQPENRRRRARSGSGGRSVSPPRGVGGRRYAAEGVNWT
ncbi:MAG: hypothetical protein Q9219_002941 [cf. Caloplaca sp. 3 TL-2023]